LAKLDPFALPLVNGAPRLGTPVKGVGKCVAIGLNYVDHAQEANLPIPKWPLVFLKATSSLSGANDTVMLPELSTKGDWEVELGIVIGRRASYVEEDKALDHVAGYCIVNDVSEREYQLDVNGERMQTGNTRTMIFSCATLISYVSRLMTLLPGDIITTGTPPGVGLGKKPNPIFLKPGDVMTLGIEKLGEQRQQVVAWRRMEA
jgi:2-keto-4-pentenoate hydratase/2-oxohepta-3-ene-1,7-dioic acid hydratase in catechol pathway